MSDKTIIAKDARESCKLTAEWLRKLADRIEAGRLVPLEAKEDYGELAESREPVELVRLVLKVMQ